MNAVSRSPLLAVSTVRAFPTSSPSSFLGTVRKQQCFRYSFLGIMCFFLWFLIFSILLTYYLCNDCHHHRYTYDYSILLTSNTTVIHHSSATTDDRKTYSSLSSSSSAGVMMVQPLPIEPVRIRNKLRKRPKRKDTTHTKLDDQLTKDSNNVRTLASSLEKGVSQTFAFSPASSATSSPSGSMILVDTKVTNSVSTTPSSPASSASPLPLYVPPVRTNSICSSIDTVLHDLPLPYRNDLCSLYSLEYDTNTTDIPPTIYPTDYTGLPNKPKLPWQERLSKVADYYHRTKSFVEEEGALRQQPVPYASFVNDYGFRHQQTASYLVAQGTPSFNPDGSPSIVWNTSLLSAYLPLTRAQIHQRTAWGIQCRKISRSVLSANHLSMNPSLNRNVEYFHTSYFELKEIAMRIYYATNYLWLPAPDGKGPPKITTPFYTGPWLEEYWYYTFVTPIIRNITLAEYQYHKRRHIQGIKLVSNHLLIPDKDNSTFLSFYRSVRVPDQDIATLNIDDFRTILTDSGRKNHDYILHELEQSEINQDVYPSHLFNYTTSIQYEVPLVTIEEPFDFLLFYPYVPLFIPWDRIAVYYKSVSANIEDLGDNHHQYISAVDKEVGDIEELLLSFTYTHVNYITVVQRAAGIFIRNKNLQLLLDNTIQINAGGGGDIPVPLLAKEHSLLPSIFRNPYRKQWKHGLTFLGTEREGIRETMLTTLQKDHPWYRTEKSIGNFTSFTSSLFYTHFYSSSDTSTVHVSSSSSLILPSWMQDMMSSFLQLAPRGTNPSSFRFYEVLQLGLIPVYIYDNHYPWLPYQPSFFSADDAKKIRAVKDNLSFWNRTGIILHIDELLPFLDFLPLLTQEYENINTDTSSSSSSVMVSRWYRFMIERIASLRSIYFTYEGIVRHIYRLLRDPLSSELYCQPAAQDYTKNDPFQRIPR